MTGVRAASDGAAGRGRAAIGAAVVAAATLAAYADGLRGPFIFDDTKSILENPTIRSLRPPWGPLAPPENLGVGGRPILNLSFALNYAWGGFRVAGYHALNVAILVGCALALFGILRRTFDRLGQPALAPALVGTLLWSLHPVLTNAVTYVSERSESLMGLFYLLTLYCFIRGAGEAGHGRTWLAAAWLACLLGMATKEVMATAPLLVLLYDRTFAAGSFREAWRRRAGFYAALAATWVPLGFLMRGLGQRGAGFGLGVGPWSYALTECRAALLYLRLAAWPHPLVLDYGPGSSGAAASAAAAFAVLALLAATAWALVRRPALGFCAAAFFLILAPTSSVVPIALQPVAESRLYLPLAALAGLAGWGLASAAGRRGAAFGFALAGAFGIATAARNADYRTAVRIWTDTAAKEPANARARYNLGTALLGEPGSLPEAVAELEAAARLDPADAEIRFNLGLALDRSGRPGDAMAQYAAALALRPGYARARVNLGILLAAAGRGPEALQQFAWAARLAPGLAEAHFDLAAGLEAAGRAAEALPEFERAASLDPGDAEYRRRLAMALAGSGRVADAVGQYEAALALRPVFPEAEYGLANALARERRWDEAIGHYRAAVREAPGFVAAHANLGAALAVEGRLDEAVEEFRAAARLDPRDPKIRRNLETALRASGQAP